MPRFKNNNEIENSVTNHPSNIKINHREENGVCIITVEGVLGLEESCFARDYISKLLDNSQTEAFIVNFQRVNQMDPNGMGWMVWAYRECQPRKKKIVFCELVLRDQFINQLLQLNRYLRIYPTEKLALASSAKKHA